MLNSVFIKTSGTDAHIGVSADIPISPEQGVHGADQIKIVKIKDRGDFSAPSHKGKVQGKPHQVMKDDAVRGKLIHSFGKLAGDVGFPRGQEYLCPGVQEFYTEEAESLQAVFGQLCI